VQPSAKKWSKPILVENGHGHFGPVGSIHVFIAIPLFQQLPSNAFANDLLNYHCNNSLNYSKMPFVWIIMSGV